MKNIFYLGWFYLIGFVAVIFLNNTVALKNEGLIYITKGKTTDSTVNILFEEGYIYDKFAFKILKYITGSKIKSGEYKIQNNENGFVILNKIHNNQVHYRKLTVVPGTTIKQLTKQLLQNPYLKGELNDINPNTLLLADTYNYSRGINVNDIVVMMEDNFNNKIKSLWANRAEKLPFNDYKSAYTFASIVEKETGLDSERALVASVFINRLNINMKLQSDPTVIYAVSNGWGKIDRPISKTDLKTKSPYNTYYTKGLPPTPIAIVGEPALKATLNPQTSKYFYFVADGNGGHNFAKTLKQHNKNVKAYRKLNQQ